ncbi:MAG: DUF3500 domain-containing protein [Planctomycetes bacterium]|nr:DUF3500 domain-containing protein [Planctomycetota bacterium]
MQPSLAHLSRRRFLASGAALAAAAPLAGADEPTRSAETLAQALHATLTPAQREVVCFPWDYVHPKFGLLRTRVGNNWNATKPELVSDFFTGEQKRLVRDIFEQLIRPEWQGRIDKQLEDDAGGFGHAQSIALIGEPGSGKFQFLMTGRHMTLRCDGDSAEHVAFGGPIFYGHDPGGFNEEATHPGNVFWPQALAANKVAAMLDGRQRELALVAKQPAESAVAFKGSKLEQGIAVTELSADQRAELEHVLAVLLEPYRAGDQAEVRRCLSAQGGLDACRLAFYRDGDIGDDGVWDCWRLEGPAFVWHYRGAPHVHVWVNIADSPDVPTNT